jgi:NADP-dependent 3-hydroxy acid dehydrogenase YdfG
LRTPQGRVINPSRVSGTHTLTLEVTDAAQIQAAVERVESLDILVNNAGVALFDDLSDRAALEQPWGAKTQSAPRTSGVAAPDAGSG